MTNGHAHPITPDGATQPPSQLSDPDKLLFANSPDGDNLCSVLGKEKKKKKRGRVQRRQLRMLSRACHVSAVLTQTCPSTSTRRTLAEGCCSHKTARTFWEEPPQRNVSLENIPCEERLGELEIMKVEKRKHTYSLYIFKMQKSVCMWGDFSPPAWQQGQEQWAGTAEK